MGDDVAEVHRCPDAEQGEHEKISFGKLVQRELVANAGHELEMRASEQVAEQVFRKLRDRRHGGRIYRFIRCFSSYIAGMRQRGSVTAGNIQQRRQHAAVVCEHFTDENDMVAAFILVHGAALKARAAAGNQRRGRLAQFERERLELVFAGARKTVRQCFLLRGEDVDIPEAAVAEGCTAMCCFCNAPQDHRRIERDGIEAVDRDANGRAVGSARGNDGHAGGKFAKCLAEVAGIETCRAAHCILLVLCPRMPRHGRLAIVHTD